jgi:hypothetical protein
MRADVPAQIDREVFSALEGLSADARRGDAPLGEAVLDRRRS